MGSCHSSSIPTSQLKDYNTSDEEFRRNSSDAATDEQSDLKETFTPTDYDKGESLNGKQSNTKSFAVQVWRQNSQKSLRLILSGQGKQFFRKFLAKENNEHHVDFYEQVKCLKEQSSEDVDSGEDEAMYAQAVELYNKYARARGEQDVNLPGKFKNWSSVNDPLSALEKVQDEVLCMLSMDCFPRFLGSEECADMLDSFKDSELRDNVNESKRNVPSNIDEWLDLFTSIADLLPTCIVIADKMAAGVPIIFVNQAFTETTLYSKDESEGRNCRFLQGPKTNPESVELIRYALANNRECHVNILNYRKNGEPFRNLLSMKPVFGHYNDCEYYIGVQYEVTDDSMMVTRLLQHEHLLEMLPSQVFSRGVA